MTISIGKKHTNTIYGYRGSVKNEMRGMKSLRGEHQPLFLAEFIWRHNAAVLDPSRYLFGQMLRLLGTTVTMLLWRRHFRNSVRD